MDGKSGVLAGIAHDMRAPVGAIACTAQLLLEQAEDAQAVRRQAGRILSACDELTGMIDGALDLAAEEAGRFALLEVPFVPSELVGSVKETAEALARAKEQRLYVTVEGPCGRRVIGDAGRLRRILMNLLSNAVKYTHTGGRIELKASARETDGSQRIALCFCVCDNGMGMEKETLERLFTPFERAPQARSAGIEGTGLGLSVVWELARAMGASIGVESRPGEGSAFTLELELPAAVSVSFAGRRFLLAEDNALAADVTAELLREHGAQVTLAQDGEQAVSCFAKSGAGEYDAVLMDVMMPRMDGCEAAQAIRAMDRPDAKRVPIIAMTGAATQETERRAAACGMNARAVKPVRMDALAHLLRMDEEKG